MSVVNKCLFIGVDGGGTGCRARLQDEAGRTLGEGRGGPANIRADAAFAMRSVHAACRAAVAAAGLSETALGEAAAGLGLAGAGQASALAAFRAQAHPFASLAVETDAYAAWLGAFGGADGAIIIVGTGSCGLAVVQGAQTYVGGSGAEISDEGSGAAIGREALRRALWAQDGRAPMTALTAELLASFKGSREAIVDWARAARPADFARFAPLVLDHARGDDPLAREIIAEAAAEIARIAERLLEAGAPRLALVGGLSDPLRPFLPDGVKTRLIAPAADAVEGALLIARRANATRRDERKSA